MIFRNLSNFIKKNKLATAVGLFYIVSSILCILFFQGLRSEYMQNMFIIFYSLCTLGFVGLESYIVLRKTDFKNKYESAYRIYRICNLFMLLCVSLLAFYVTYTVRQHVFALSARVYQRLSSIIATFVIISSTSTYSLVPEGLFSQVRLVLFTSTLILKVFLALIFTIAAIKLIIDIYQYFHLHGIHQIDVKVIKSEHQEESEIEPHTSLSFGFVYKPIP